MSRRPKPLFLGVFQEEAALLSAARSTLLAGYRIHDAYTPYAVHGLDRALGLRPSRMPWVCLAFALTGLLAAVLGQYWTMSIDWPLNVGGKPDNSLPAYLPVTFEATVLAAGVGTVLVLLVRSGLQPGRATWLPHERVTDDRFVLAVEADGADFDGPGLTALWERCGFCEAIPVPADLSRTYP